jgi:DNA polymerase III delta subunit
MKFDLQKAVSQRVVLLQSAEGPLVAQGLQHLLAAHTPPDEPLEHELFVGDASTPGDWVGAAGVVPFLTDSRVVVVRGLGRCNPSKVWDVKITKGHPFVASLSSLPDTARLILVGDEEGGNQEKRQAAQDQIEKWSRLVGHAGGMVAKLDLSAEESIEALTARAAASGKKLSKDLATKLTQMLGGQTGLALAEVDKLVLYIGADKAISEAAIDALVIPELDYNIFQLADGVFRGDTRFAMRQLQLLNTRIPDMSGEAMSRVLPMLHRHLRFAWQARICVEAKCQPGTAPESVKAMFPDKPILASEKDWIQKKHLDAARGLTLKQLSACLNELSKADQKLKGILPYFSPEETIEVLVLTMAEICRDPKRQRV